VGHRHHTHVQYLDQDLKDRIRAMATSVTKYADQQTIVVNDQQRFRRFLEGIQFFSEHYDQRTEDIKRRMIDAVMRIVTTTNLRVDTGEVYAKLAPAALDNYYECEDTSDKLKYLDIGVDLTRLPKI
jgi:Lon protease-like protein